MTNTIETKKDTAADQERQTTPAADTPEVQTVTTCIINTDRLQWVVVSDTKPSGQ